MRATALLPALAVLAMTACTRYSPKHDATDLDAAKMTPPTLTGRYRYVASADSTAGCLLDAAERGEDSVQFLLSCNRGAPSYNMGMMRGTAELIAQTFTVRVTEYGGECVLSVVFTHRAAVVRQTGDGAACGFGNGVTARGTYSKVDDGMPTFETEPR